MLFRNRVFVVDERGRDGRRLRAVRRAHLPAAVPAGRARASPTASGLQLLPVMGGLLISSIVSGQVITRTGRYKAWPTRGRRSRRSACGCSRRWTRRRRGRGGVPHARARARPRDGDAGARAGRPERGALRHARRRDVGLDAVPLDRRLARHRRPGRDLHGAARVRAGRRRQRRRRGGLDPSAIRRLPQPVHDAYIAAFTDALHSCSSSRRSSSGSRSCCRGSSRSGRCARRSRPTSGRPSAGRSTPTP